MRPPFVTLSALTLLSLLGFPPPAGALGAGVCTISGTISFSPSPQTPMHGGWGIDPAVIESRGLFRSWDRILRPGPFTGSGSYSIGRGNSGPCLHHAGRGTVDYMIHTAEQDVHIVEPHDFVVARGGTFMTPTLSGTLQVVPPSDGQKDCLTTQVTKAFLFAQVVMTRFPSRP
jgi:hypothetical protein